MSPLACLSATAKLKRARCRKTPQVARRKAPAASRDRCGCHRFALFGAPSPWEEREQHEPRIGVAATVLLVCRQPGESRGPGRHTQSRLRLGFGFRRNDECGSREGAR